eukprot:CAMPEP_0114981338 /NCGR_PEP_ID=MMETSP0216-20121206/5488_1 /TAXON_ID=223996 /ORGANISM="Protocruzia adherens, Strain Boccale" /LENGTH=1455 /DNA_ID=CAMNT_0002342997 /DNA_START=218 /DNA_END=4585 /DNA_ORIENTATION=+
MRTFAILAVIGICLMPIITAAENPTLRHHHTRKVKKQVPTQTVEAGTLNLDAAAAVQIVEGVLSGALRTVDLPSINKCFEGTENVVTKCISAVHSFEQHTASSVKNALVEFAQAFSEVPAAVKTCTSAVHEAETLAKQIDHFAKPITFLFKVGESLIVNGKEIFGEIDTAISDFKSGDFYDGGYEIGVALATVLDGAHLFESDASYDSFTTAKGIQIVEGLLEGALKGLNLSTVVTCFDDAKNVVTESVSAVELFSKGGASNVEQALKEIAQAFSEVPTAITACTSAVKAAETLTSEIKNFSSPLTFAYEVGKSLIVNGVEIYHDIDSAVEDFKQDNYYDFGYQIGLALGTVLEGTQQYEAELAQTTSEALEIVEGLLAGALNGAHLGDIVDCFEDAEHVIAECVSAVELFEQHSADSVKDALSKFAEAFSQVPTAVKTCTSAVHEAETLAAQIKNFASPWTFLWKVGKSLIVNGREIFSDIDGAINDFKTEQYYQAGYEIGTALAVVLEGTSQIEQAVTADVSEGLQIVEGFLEGALNGVHLSEFVNCFDDADSVINQCINAVQLFKQGGASNIEEALKDIVGAFSSVPNAISTCTTAVQDAETLAHEIKTFTSPLNFLYEVGKSIVVNGVEIYEDVHAAINDFESQQYEQFGNEIGTIVAIVYEGTQSSTADISPAVSNGLKIVEGLLSGALKTAGLSDITSCFEDADNVVTECMSGVKAFEQHTASSIATALKDFAGAFSQVPTAISTCKEAVAEAETLAREIENFSSPKTLLFKIGESLIVNGKEIFDDVSGAVKDFKNGQYYNGGYQIGVAMATVLDGADNIHLLEVQRAQATSEGLQIVEGLLEGTLDGIGLSEIVSCFDDAKNVIEESVNAVELFSKGGASNVEQALKEIASAFSQVPTAISTCTSAVKDAETLATEIKNFASPLTFFYEVGKSLLVNGVEIYDDVHTAIEDFKQDNYYDFGYQVGLALGTVLHGTQQLEAEALAVQSEGLQIVEGLLEGALDGVGLSEIVSCFDDAESVVSECVNAVELFSKGGAHDVEQALKEIASAFSQVPTAISTCTTAVHDAETLAAEIKTFASPLSFLWKVGKSLIVNGVEIYDDVKTGIEDFEDKQYHDFGFQIGLALGTVLNGTQKTDDALSQATSEGLQIVEGLLEGALNGLSLSDIISCFNDAKNVITESVSAVELFSKGGASDVEQALKEIAQAFSEVPSAISTCTTAYKDAETLVNMIEGFASPLSFAYKVGKSLIVNGVEIYHDIDTAVSDFHAGNYKQFGYEIGVALGTVVNGANVVQTTNLEVSTISKLEEVSQIVDGLLSGALQTDKLTDVVDCIHDGDSLLQGIEGAVKLFEEETASSVEEGLKALATALGELPSALSTCKEAESEAEQLAKQLSFFKDPSSIKYRIGKSLLLNGVEIFKNIYGGVSDYKSGNYYQFGYDIGTALAELLGL